MTKRSIALTAKRMLSTAWSEIHGHLRKINKNIPLRPKSPSEVVSLKTKTTDTATFDLGPIVFFLPYKAAGKSTARIYAVIAGELTLEDVPEYTRLRTKCYGTRIAYFQPQNRFLRHVFGAHYDFDPRLGHPVFHAQITSHPDYAKIVASQFSNAPGLNGLEDRVKDVFRSVRMPTAQMDFFAVILQVCSDHLINEHTSETIQEHYRNMRTACHPFASYGLGHNGLQTSISDQCFRSVHWYDHPV